MSLLIYTLYGFAIFFFAGWCFVWLIHMLALFNGKLRLHKKVQPPSAEDPVPGVSIIKPLIGVDGNLFSNLETFFTMSYPRFEILFCIQFESDPSIMLVHRLMEKYPKIDAKLFIGGKTVGVNPKINNMHPGYEAAKYELILVSDSGIRMKEDTLLDMASFMLEDVALVHQMPFTSDRNGFPAILEKVFFGTSQARVYLAADLLNINCCTGMSCLMRKNVLDEIGGFKSFGQYLAEDFFFAKSFIDRGWKMKVSSQPALQNTAGPNITNFQERITRWTKLRFAMIPIITLLEPFSECMLIGAIGALVTNFLFNWDIFGVYLIHVLVWFLMDWILLSIVQNGPIPFSKREFIIAWTFREISAIFLFFRAIYEPDIKWRTRTYRLKWGGFADEIKPRMEI